MRWIAGIVDFVMFATAYGVVIYLGGSLWQGCAAMVAVAIYGAFTYTDGFKRGSR